MSDRPTPRRVAASKGRPSIKMIASDSGFFEKHDISMKNSLSFRKWKFNGWHAFLASANKWFLEDDIDKMFKKRIAHWFRRSFEQFQCRCSEWSNWTNGRKCSPVWDDVFLCLTPTIEKMTQSKSTEWRCSVRRRWTCPTETRYKRTNSSTLARHSDGT